MAEQAPATPLALLRRFGPLALVAVGLILAIVFDLPRQLSLHELHRHREQLVALSHSHPVLSVLGYVGVYTLVIGLSMPGAMIMTLTGGFLFGPWVGGIAATFGSTFGASVVFLVCRTAAGDVLRRRAGPTIARIEDGVLADAFSYVMILRLLPVVPMTLSNLALGFVEIPLRTFILATFVGILPVSLIYANLGAGLGKLFAAGTRPHLHDLVTPQVIAALAGLALLSFAPILFRRLRGRKT